MEERCYTVYMHKNIINNKIYIGITRNNVKFRWRNGNNYANCTKMNNAIKKYGWNNFEHIIICKNLTKEEAEQKEIELIKKYNSIKNGYNIENGGNCLGKTNNITRKKISLSLKKYYLKYPEVKKRISQMQKGNKYCLGKKLSQETKNKISKSHLNNKKTKKYKKSVICIETGIIYESIKKASRETNIDSRCICKVCNNEKYRKTAGKYHWEFYPKERRNLK